MNYRCNSLANGLAKSFGIRPPYSFTPSVYPPRGAIPKRKEADEKRKTEQNASDLSGVVEPLLDVVY